MGPRASAVRCCDEPCSDLRQGRELDIESYEIEEADESETAAKGEIGVKG